MSFPLWDKQYDNVDLRQALSYALDRGSLAKLVGIATPAVGYATNSLDGYRTDACAACTLDVAKAEDLLAKAGGFDGKLKIYFSSESPTSQAYAQAVGNMWRKSLGIDVQYVPKTASEITGLATTKKLDGIRFTGRGYDYPSIEDMLTPMFASYGDANFSGCVNKAVDAALQKARSESDPQKSIALFQGLEDLVYKDLPLIPVSNGTNVYLHSSRVVDDLLTRWTAAAFDTAAARCRPGASPRCAAPPGCGRECMIRFTLGRLLVMIPIAFVVTFLVYAMMFALHGDPILQLAGDKPLAPSVIAAKRAQFHLDQPLVAQYWYFMSNLAHGHLGTTFDGQDIASKFKLRRPVTIKLGLMILAFQWTVGLLVGIYAGWVATASSTGLFCSPRWCCSPSPASSRCSSARSCISARSSSPAPTPMSTRSRRIRTRAPCCRPSRVSLSIVDGVRGSCWRAIRRRR